jgi:hypothetical protein
MNTQHEAVSDNAADKHVDHPLGRYRCRFTGDNESDCDAAAACPKPAT